MAHSLLNQHRALALSQPCSDAAVSEVVLSEAYWKLGCLGSSVRVIYPALAGRSAVRRARRKTLLNQKERSPFVKRVVNVEMGTSNAFHLLVAPSMIPKEKLK